MSGPANPGDYPDAVKECWAVHEALRTLGFSSDDIYVASGHDGWQAMNPPALFVILRAQEKEFIVTLGTYESDSEIEVALSQWTEFATRFNSGEFDKTKMERIFDDSNVVKNKVQFVMALTGKGFSFPAGAN